MLFFLMMCHFPEFVTCKIKYHFLQMPRHLWKLQAFPELPRHFRKCLISSIACDSYNTNINDNKLRITKKVYLLLSESIAVFCSDIVLTHKRFEKGIVKSLKFVVVVVINCNYLCWLVKGKKISPVSS